MVQRKEERISHMRPIAGLSFVALLLALLSACGARLSAGRAAELNVFAAASLTEAFGEIGGGFEAANAGVTVVFSFAGSQQLAQQIGQGAPVDVFASANQAQMNNVIASGQVTGGTERVFARNRLVVITPPDNPTGIQMIQDLAKPGVKLVLADQSVPVGQYALDFLARASLLPEYTETYRSAVLHNVVSYEENVRAVLSKVSLGEADAGIVYTSDVTGDAANNLGRLTIPDGLNTIAAYSIAPIKDSPNADLAQLFVDYLLSPGGQQILAKHGFIPLDDGAAEFVPLPLLVGGTVAR